MWNLLFFSILFCVVMICKGGNQNLQDENSIYFPSLHDYSFAPFQSSNPQQIFNQFFRNFESNLHNIFKNNIDEQRRAMEAAQRAFDATMSVQNNNNQAGSNNAYAAAYLGPSGSHQVAGINPSNPNTLNVDVSTRDGTGPQSASIVMPNNNGYYSVSSSSYSSSGTDPSGKLIGSRGAQTIINNNGRVKQYSVQS